MSGELLKIRGQVQGVGFRPTVWRVASQLGLTGDVRNSGDGVEIRIWGSQRDKFEQSLRQELPSLAQIESLEIHPISDDCPHQFEITKSSKGASGANITADVAICEACLKELRDPFENRYWYPFINCTNCGPRFSIIENTPYDRHNTTMGDFPMCKSCAVEYNDPKDRRFHAQPVACHSCGPHAWLEHLGGGAVNAEAFSMMGDVDAAGGALMNGHIVAIKGIGGVHIACDATKKDVVARLRQRKRRYAKPFALMARDLTIIRQYAKVSAQEEALLTSPAAPIVLLEARGTPVAEGVAPSLKHLGFMLPATALQHQLLRRMKRPVIMTSGNLSGEPQCITNDDIKNKLSQVAEFALLHNLKIANRIDDSLVRYTSGKARILRRARGYAPKPIPLPKGFDQQSEVLSLGGELKNSFCLIKQGQAIVSQHMGDLENIATFEDMVHNLALYKKLFKASPSAIAVDQHPDYISTKHGYKISGERPIIEVQHHHAHIAACLVENDYPLSGKPVLGIAMDGLGLGDDGTFWGGEFLVCDYHGYKRIGTLKPVPLAGGGAAVKEPWRNLYTHLTAEMSWAELSMNFADLPVLQKLENMPRGTIDKMIENEVNAPLSSSCGRLFDAAAALVGLAWDQMDYEGQAAQYFEAALDPSALSEPDELAYPFSIPLIDGTGMPYIEPLAVWRAMLGDLILKTPVGTISARFHRGLAKAIGAMASRLTVDSELTTVALSGGCFQNATLSYLVEGQLKSQGLTVLTHSIIPANDGGLALGQAAIAAASLKQVIGCNKED